MGKNSKERKEYLALNIILILIILILILYIFLKIKNNKEKIINEFEYYVNTSSIIKEESRNTLKNDKETIIVNIEEDNNEKYDFNEITNNRYYYNQLSKNAKLIYDSIEKNLNNMMSGKYEIKLSEDIGNDLKNANGEEKLNQDFQSAWDALFLDRTDVFFIDVSKINLHIKKMTYVNNVSYSLKIVPRDKTGYLKSEIGNEENLNKMLKNIKNIREEIINKLTGDKYNKILQAHDWIIENLEYSLDLKNMNVYNLYGALVEKKAVCEGYAKTFKFILDELGIPCIIVSGKATNSEGLTENHAWNYVELDGKWYAVDATWDDPVIRGFGYITNATKHKYFLKGSKVMNENHTSVGRMTEKGQEFIYPDLEEKDYKK